jgi:tetratricopeptide (TPR) repeat protein
MIHPVIERAVLLLAAAAAAVWLGSSYHSARLEARAQEIAERPPEHLTRADVDEAVDLFERSREREPGTRPLLLEAGLLARAGHQERARGLLEDAVRREPENHDVWVLLGRVTVRSDPERSREARRRALELSPPVARSPGD